MQLTAANAETISKAAAKSAMGFGPIKGMVTVDASEIIALAERAAWIALERAGLLRDAEQSSRDEISRLASQSKAREAYIKSNINWK
jgi:hypothetical protein